MGGSHERLVHLRYRPCKVRTPYSYFYFITVLDTHFEKKPFRKILNRFFLHYIIYLKLYLFQRSKFDFDLLFSGTDLDFKIILSYIKRPIGPVIGICSQFIGKFRKMNMRYVDIVTREFCRKSVSKYNTK